MLKSIPRFLATTALTVATVTMAAACGGDTKAACDTIQAEIQNINSKGMSQVGNPAALKQTYLDGAAKIRVAGKDAGGDVESSANEVAAALETLGNQAGNPSGGAASVNTAPLIAAGTKLKAACE
jgi:hypothetical protein